MLRQAQQPQAQQTQAQRPLTTILSKKAFQKIITSDYLIPKLVPEKCWADEN